MHSAEQTLNEGGTVALHDPVLRDFASLAAMPDDRLMLDRAALEVARIAYPDLDADVYLGKLDGLAEAVHARLAGAATKPDQPLEAELPVVLAAINAVLFEQSGLRGNSDNYGDPRNSFINDVLDRGLGIPISLSVVYIEVARRLGLEMEGVSFPGHFLAMTSYGDGIVVLDPFFGGITLSEEQVLGRIRRVVGDELATDDNLAHFLRPASTREIVARMLRNLKGAYVAAGEAAKAIPASDRLLLLMPDDADEVRARGEIYRQLDCFRPAVADFQRYLMLAPDAVDADVVRAHLIHLKGAISRLH